MKNKINLITKLLLIAGISFFFSCKKKDTAASDAVTPPIPMGTLGIHLHTNIGATEDSIGTNGLAAPITDNSGRKIMLDTAQFYISGIVLNAVGGTSYPLSGVYVLKTIGTEEYMLGSVPAGNYTSISFNIGVDPTSNAQAPSAYAASSPLANTFMWTGSTNTGYKFMDVRGYADTSAAQNAPVSQYQYFSFQLGTIVETKTINMPTQAFSVVANQTQLVHIICDYGNFLKNINFKTQNMASSFGTNTSIISNQLNPTLNANTNGMFRYE